MFGEDAQVENKSSKGLSLDKTQIDIINTSWKCQAPDRLSAYRHSYKQAFPIQSGSDTEKLLLVPSLDELSERLLIKKHGRRAAFGNTQTLFNQPFKSMEKIAYQGQVAARMGIISMCYAQQALGSLLQNLKSSSPNMAEAVQNVQDILLSLQRHWINLVALEPSTSRKLLRIKVTPDLHLTYSKNGGNLGLVLKMNNTTCILILLTKLVKYTYLYLFKFVLYNIVAFKANQ